MATLTPRFSIPGDWGKGSTSNIRIECFQKFLILSVVAAEGERDGQLQGVVSHGQGDAFMSGQAVPLRGAARRCRPGPGCSDSLYCKRSGKHLQPFSVIFDAIIFQGLPVQVQIPGYVIS